MRRKSDEQKLLFDPYVSLSTIQRYFSLQKNEALEIFEQSQCLDEKCGYLKIYPNKVRSEAVFQTLGLDLNLAIDRYASKISLKMQNKEKEGIT